AGRPAPRPRRRAVPIRNPPAGCASAVRAARCGTGRTSREQRTASAWPRTSGDGTGSLDGTDGPPVIRGWQRGDGRRGAAAVGRHCVGARVGTVLLVCPAAYWSVPRRRTFGACNPEASERRTWRPVGKLALLLLEHHRCGGPMPGLAWPTIRFYASSGCAAGRWFGTSTAMMAA